MDSSDGLERALLKDGDDMSGGGMLQDFVTEFTKQRAIVVRRLQTLRDGDCSTWQEEVKAAEKALREMDSIRSQVRVQMRLELSGTTNSQKQHWDTRLQDWENETRTFRAELTSTNEEQSRRSLLGSGLQASQRASAMSSTELLQESTKKLEDIKMQALETEEISMGILSDLHSQRETILNMRSNMGIVGSELSSAARSLTRLIRGAQQKQMLTYLVAFVLMLGLTMGLLSYLGFSWIKTLMVAGGIVIVSLAGLVARQRLRNRNSDALDIP
jgi:chromosome segregation ATPase